MARHDLPPLPPPDPSRLPEVPGQPPGYTPQGYPQGYPPLHGVAPRANNKAIAALVVSIAGLVVGCLAPFTGIAAIVLAHVARGEITRSRGAETGTGMAVAGEIIGWIEVALILLAMVVITGLVLLGNQTKNVFSNISAGLGG